MEKKSADDDCEDSGAETGGSDYSRMSSTSSELSVDDLQDPFLVSIHIITDPGESKCLQDAIDKLLAWIHPDLQLFRVSERRISKKRKLNKGFSCQPALAVILFLQEEYGEEQILHLHDCFKKTTLAVPSHRESPWQIFTLHAMQPRLFHSGIRHTAMGHQTGALWERDHPLHYLLQL